MVTRLLSWVSGDQHGLDQGIQVLVELRPTYIGLDGFRWILLEEESRLTLGS